MAKPKSEVSMDVSNVPTYFADQPAGLMVGPFVTKLTFGVQDDDESPYPRPVVTIAIPTVALSELVSDLRFVLDDETFKKTTAKQLDVAKNTITSGIRITPSVAVREMTASKPKAPKKKLIEGKKR